MIAPTLPPYGVLVTTPPPRLVQLLLLQPCMPLAVRIRLLYMPEKELV